jgi:cytochrome c oxidase subunit 3
MAGTIARGESKGPGGTGFGEDGFGGFHGGDLPPGTVRRVYKTGIFLALLAITMMFVAFTSAYIVRGGMSDDWQPIELPRVLWLNAALLLLSSFTMNEARRALKNGIRAACNIWLSLTTLLGAAFLGGQLLAWKQLSAHGIYLASNPSSSFFYLLTGAHGVHLLGGLLALLYVDVEAWRYRLGPAKRTLVEVAAIYWHFMDALWIYILFLLWFRR